MRMEMGAFQLYVQASPLRKGIKLAALERLEVLCSVGHDQLSFLLRLLVGAKIRAPVGAARDVLAEQA